MHGPRNSLSIGFEDPLRRVDNDPFGQLHDAWMVARCTLGFSGRETMRVGRDTFTAPGTVAAERCRKKSANVEPNLSKTATRRR